ncbi:hypothetical protein JOB18_008898 [Solea senegalensis]|uniref:Uncharacterized protein n=1 Tax=Solea senegalensis TaxID=28829 RepID=A0AAV6RG82_SOLSE|nr:hypothetical protein JOB18_008898 [Solea senegalensis]
MDERAGQQKDIVIRTSSSSSLLIGSSSQSEYDEREQQQQQSILTCITKTHIDKERNEGVTVDEEHHLREPWAQFSLLFHAAVNVPKKKLVFIFEGIQFHSSWIKDESGDAEEPAEQVQMLNLYQKFHPLTCSLQHSTDDRDQTVIETYVWPLFGCLRSTICSILVKVMFYINRVV